MSAGHVSRVFVLAAVAGFVDAACYVRLRRLFVAHITGDTNLVGQHLGRAEAAAALPFGVAVFTFVVSIALATLALEVATRRRLRSPLAFAFTLEGALLAALMVGGGLLGRAAGARAVHFYPLLVLAVAAMGTQTAAVTKAGDRTVRTTYMSGMLTRFAQDVGNLVLRPAAHGEPSYLRDRLGLTERRRSVNGVGIYLSLWVCFVAGGVAGVAGVHRFELWALAAPLAVLVVLIAADVASNR